MRLKYWIKTTKAIWEMKISLLHADLICKYADKGNKIYSWLADLVYNLLIKWLWNSKQRTRALNSLLRDWRVKAGRLRDLKTSTVIMI